MPRRTVRATALLVLFVSGCAAGNGAGVGTADRAPDHTGSAARSASVSGGPISSRLIERRCDLADDLPVADCYWFEVPEDRSSPDSGRIRLWVAVVHGTGSMASDLPAIGLAGGPGDTDSTAWVSGNLVFAGGSNPPLVVLDQRGTGRSRPRLSCPELDPTASATGSIDELVAGRRAALTSCRDRLVAEGVDLNGYDTIESATDVVELRRALGIEHWIVQGWSYGGRLAQEVYRQDPDGVAGLVLDGTMTTRPWRLAEVIDNAQSAIDKVDAACAAARQCPTEGEFKRNLLDAESRLDRDPHEVEATGLVVDGPLLRAGVVEALYRSDLTESLPGVVAALATGDFSSLDVLAEQVTPAPQSDVEGTAEALRQIVTCADEGSDPDGMRLLTEGGGWSRRLLFHFAFCDIWDVDANVPIPVRGGAPVLAFVGEFDPVQPEAFTRETTDGLANVTVVVVPGGGHRNAYSNDCTQSITLAFYAEPTTAVDLSCIENLSGPFGR